jgi:hypothetical protein
MADCSILSTLFLAEQGFFSSERIVRLGSAGFEPICARPHPAIRFDNRRVAFRELSGAESVGRF